MARCVDQSFGRVSRDASLSNLKVNSIAALDVFKSCSPPVTITTNTVTFVDQFSNDDIIDVYSQDQGEYFSLNDFSVTVQNVFSVGFETNSNKVVPTGENNASIQFLEGGDYKISLYISLKQMSSEDNSNQNIRFCFSNNLPTSSTPYQITPLVPGVPGNLLYMSNTISFSISVSDNEVYSLYLSGVTNEFFGFQINRIILLVQKV